MRYSLLSLAISAAVQAAPIQSPSISTSTLDRTSNILLGRSGYIEGRSETDISTRQLPDYDTENEVWDYDVVPTADTLSDLVFPSATPSTTSSSEPAFIGEEDPELYQILLHVENILSSSSATPDEQIEWILDAIVHPTESLRESEEDLWTSDELLDFVDEVLDEDFSDDEKVEIIFGGIASHSKLRGTGEEPTREPVLLRVKAVLYGPGSDQQKIKGILDEIADHLGTSDFGPDWAAEQVSMAEIEEEEVPPTPWYDEDATDLGDSANWSYDVDTLTPDTM